MRDDRLALTAAFGRAELNAANGRKQQANTKCKGGGDSSKPLSDCNKRQTTELLQCSKYEGAHLKHTKTALGNEVGAFVYIICSCNIQWQKAKCERNTLMYDERKRERKKRKRETERWKGDSEHCSTHFFSSFLFSLEPPREKLCSPALFALSSPVMSFDS